MNRNKQVGFANLFRLHSLLLVTSVAGIVLGSLGLGMAAIGLLIGVSLYVINLAFLLEGGKALISLSSRRNGRMTATVAGIGRLVFLAVALALVRRLGLVPFLAACSGLLAGQVNLHLALLIEGRITGRCSGL